MCVCVMLSTEDRERQIVGRKLEGSYDGKEGLIFMNYQQQQSSKGVKLVRRLASVVVTVTAQENFEGGI